MYRESKIKHLLFVFACCSFVHLHNENMERGIYSEYFTHNESVQNNYLDIEKFVSYVLFTIIYC